MSSAALNAAMDWVSSSCRAGLSKGVADRAKARGFGAKRGVRDESGDVDGASTGLSGDEVQMGGAREWNEVWTERLRRRAQLD